jgi:glyoxylase-like metal-dependent hydrolase (beta-lactamase superfamily II)
MLFRQLFDAESSTYTYLLAAGPGREAIVIDPVLEQMPAYRQLLAELGLTLRYALDTHTHADHVTALGALRTATGCITMMGRQSGAECASERFDDGAEIAVDGVRLRALYTPGHTIESYCFLLEDRRPAMVFTGDLLLIRSTGRTDFQSGDARASYDSIVHRLFPLPDDTLVYPGHDYKGWTVSTIGEERRFNPRLQGGSVEAYEAVMKSLKLPTPKMMDVAVPANLRCGQTA